MVTIKRTNNDDKDFAPLVKELDKDLRSRYGAEQDEYDQYNKIENLDTVVIAYNDDKAVGCGCFKKFDNESVEIKRMFVSPDQRSNGIGAAILDELSKWAGEQGYQFTVLETGSKQNEAVHFYKKVGYTIIPNYGQYIGMKYSICMKRAIDKE